MARMPGAEWSPITVNYTRDGMGEIHGVTLHIMAGTLAGTDSWFRNRAAEASSHFGTGRAGALRQWVDTKDKAWAQADGNPHWISIENEGRGGDDLTDAQLDACARVLAWAHKQHGVPLRVTDSPNGRGLGHHSMGGSAWGGHLACPGVKVLAQKAEIVRRAAALVDGKPKEDTIKIVLEDGVPQWPGRVLKVTSPMMRGADVRIWQEKMAKRGWKIDVDGVFGPQSAGVAKGYRKATGLNAVAEVDEDAWSMTWSWRPPPQTPPPAEPPPPLPATCQPGLVDDAN
ncbi:peptidoglycan recognition protein family protein [Microbispora sp. CA-102843]|uniref:peptidoglycan recognition protein family protein n=1 Tax=Microbispora sp. CA-102843 TaxID=3239952 RepID=UPI003D8CB337